MSGSKIIAIVGMCGSGKSILADELTRRGWGFARFGQITLDIAKKRGVAGEIYEREIREELRRQHGMGAFAALNIPKFDKILEKQNLVADGLYSWSEYKVLKDYYHDRLTVVAVYAPPKIRYERLVRRKMEPWDKESRNRPLTLEEARGRDFAEIENIEKGGPIAMADYTILNTGTKEEFQKNIKNFISSLS